MTPQPPKKSNLVRRFGSLNVWAQLAAIVSVLLAVIAILVAVIFGILTLHQGSGKTSIVVSCPNCGSASATDTPYVVPTPTNTTAVPTSTPPLPGTTYTETAGPPSGSGTFTNYTNAGGTPGQRVAAYQTVQVSCRLTGHATKDGDTWWYRLASSPWNDAFYAPADNFYNNGQTSGLLTGTPFVDTKVTMCRDSASLQEHRGRNLILIQPRFLAFSDPLWPPIEQRGGADEVRIRLEHHTASGLSIFELVNVGEMAVGQRSIGEQPEVSRWLELGQVRWQEQKMDMVRETQPHAAVPARSRINTARLVEPAPTWSAKAASSTSKSGVLTVVAR